MIYGSDWKQHIRLCADRLGLGDIVQFSDSGPNYSIIDYAFCGCCIKKGDCKNVFDVLLDRPLDRPLELSIFCDHNGVVTDYRIVGKFIPNTQLLKAKKMRHKQHTVWTWHDADDTPRFVGYGMYSDRHPAVDRFEQRFNSDSELDIWLQSLEKEPTRKTFGYEVTSYGEAIGFTMGLRAKYADTLLKSRGPSTYAGGHPKKGVYRFCADDISKCECYLSVRDAAKAMKCNPSTITRWCQDPKNTSWGYVDKDNDEDWVIHSDGTIDAIERDDRG